LSGRLTSNAISGESTPVTRQCAGAAVAAGIIAAAICAISLDLNLPNASQALRGLMSAFE
jgi:hypothetical protein